MSSKAQFVLQAMQQFYSIGEIVPESEIAYRVDRKYGTSIELAAALYELKEAGYLEMIIGAKWKYAKASE
jgi:hypothetical protein